MLGSSSGRRWCRQDFHPPSSSYQKAMYPVCFSLSCKVHVCVNVAHLTTWTCICQRLCAVHFNVFTWCRCICYCCLQFLCDVSGIPIKRYSPATPPLVGGPSTCGCDDLCISLISCVIMVCVSVCVCVCVCECVCVCVSEECGNEPLYTTTTLYSTVLYCTTLYCTVLYCSVL